MTLPITNMKAEGIIVLVALVFSCLSCTKKAPPLPTLPSQTQEGKNTFGFLVDGNVWLPGGGFAIGLSSDYYNNGISIAARNVKRDEFILLNIGRIYKDTVVWINNYTSQSSFQYFYYGEHSINYYPVKPYSGQFHLKKLDTINRIMSGIFWFDAVDSISGKVVKIREGRFDVKY